MVLKTLAAALVAANVASQTPAPASDPQNLELARSGKAAEAWRAWQALPQNDDTLRTGVRLAVATKQLSRGIDLYTTLARQKGTPDREALSELAVGSAIDLAAVADLEVRVTACGAALILRPSEPTCRKALETMAEQGDDADERALATYALANAKVGPWLERVRALPSQPSKSTRMLLARRMTHLPAADRLMLIQSLLDDRDLATQYEAVLVATEIPGDEVLAALRNVQASPLMNPVKMAVTLAMARHGDTSGIDTIIQQLPGLGGYDKITAARVLLAVPDKRGADMLDEMIRSSVDYERLMAAEAIGKLNAIDSRRVILELVQGANVAIRQSAILAAGSLELGTEPEVYKRLVDSAPSYRAAAVDAIATTFSLQDSRRPARGL